MIFINDNKKLFVSVLLKMLKFSLQMQFLGISEVRCTLNACFATSSILQFDRILVEIDKYFI